jgi:hypothetical protein
MIMDAPMSLVIHKGNKVSTGYAPYSKKCNERMTCTISPVVITNIPILLNIRIYVKKPENAKKATTKTAISSITRIDMSQ